MAYPDPYWQNTPPPRTYERRGKTPTGEAIALKIRDIRLRKALTGSTKMPRICKKTNPKALGAEEEADSEEELNACKEGIFSAPGWVRQATKEGEHMSQVKPERLVKAQTRHSDKISSFLAPAPTHGRHLYQIPRRSR